MALFDLVSQAEHKAKREVQSFSIERPHANEEIPLGENQSWMVEGNLPVREADDHFQNQLQSRLKYSSFPLGRQSRRKASQGFPFRKLEIRIGNVRWRRLL
jgi:hypothetical protein